MFRFVGHYLLDSGPCVFNMQSFSQISRGFCLAAQARPQAPLLSSPERLLALFPVRSGQKQYGGYFDYISFFGTTWPNVCLCKT